MIQATTGVNTYSWLSSYSTQNTLVNRIAVPDGYKRIEVKSGSFAEWLRWLPLKEGKPQLKLYNGKLKGNQSVHEAIVNIDVGTTDIQQCADAVMRMRAEYLYSIKDYKNLRLNKFTKIRSFLRKVLNLASWTIRIN